MIALEYVIEPLRLPLITPSMTYLRELAQEESRGTAAAAKDLLHPMHGPSRISVSDMVLVRNFCVVLRSKYLKPPENSEKHAKGRHYWVQPFSGNRYSLIW